MNATDAGLGEGRRRRTVDALLLAGGLLLVLALLLLGPGDLLDKADHVGYAVCHQIPMRSFFFGDRQLPLCARCSGQFLGALFGLGLLLLLRRGKAGLMPPTGIMLVLFAFIAIWGFDGLNSYMTLFPNGPHLYEPNNLLRVSTGALQGVAVIALALPFFNTAFWAEPAPKRSVAHPWEVALLVLLAAAIALLVSSEVAALLYPLALLSVAGTLLLLTLVNTVLVTVLLRRDGRVKGWRDALPLLVAGLALAGLEVLAINLLRAWLTRALGLPF